MTTPAVMAPGLVPPGAVDCHIHILMPDRFPYPNPTATPPPASPVASYHRLQTKLSLERTVVVTPSNYANDNRCLLAALEELGGPTRARGVAVVDESLQDSQAQLLDRCGVRAVRFNLSRSGGMDPRAIRDVAYRVAQWGWHVEVHCSADTLVDLADEVTDLAVPLVLDHLGSVPPGRVHPAAGVVRRLLAEGNTYVKVGGWYHVSRDRSPLCDDVLQDALDLVHRAPQRVVWHSDWPWTPALRGDIGFPDVGGQLHLLLSNLTREEAEQLFVTNPERLYGFPPFPPVRRLVESTDDPEIRGVSGARTADH